MSTQDLEQQWQDLSPTSRAIVIGAGAVDLALRAVALIDLVRRPSDEVRGPKIAWGAALAVVSSAGILPLAYLALGRRR